MIDLLDLPNILIAKIFKYLCSNYCNIDYLFGSSFMFRNSVVSLEYTNNVLIRYSLLSHRFASSIIPLVTTLLNLYIYNQSDYRLTVQLSQRGLTTLFTCKPINFLFIYFNYKGIDNNQSIDDTTIKLSTINIRAGPLLYSILRDKVTPTTIQEMTINFEDNQNPSTLEYLKDYLNIDTLPNLTCLYLNCHHRLEFIDDLLSSLLNGNRQTIFNQLECFSLNSNIEKSTLQSLLESMGSTLVSLSLESLGGFDLIVDFLYQKKSLPLKHLRLIDISDMTYANTTRLLQCSNVKLKSFTTDLFNVEYRPDYFTNNNPLVLLQRLEIFKLPTIINNKEMLTMLLNSIVQCSQPPLLAHLDIKKSLLPSDFDLSFLKSCKYLQRLSVNTGNLKSVFNNLMGHPVLTSLQMENPADTVFDEETASLLIGFQSSCKRLKYLCTHLNFNSKVLTPELTKRYIDSIREHRTLKGFQYYFVDLPILVSIVEVLVERSYDPNIEFQRIQLLFGTPIVFPSEENVLLVDQLFHHLSKLKFNKLWMGIKIEENTVDKIITTIEDKENNNNNDSNEYIHGTDPVRLVNRIIEMFKERQIDTSHSSFNLFSTSPYLAETDSINRLVNTIISQKHVDPLQFFVFRSLFKYKVDSEVIIRSLCPNIEIDNSAYGKVVDLNQSREVSAVIIDHKPTGYKISYRLN
ncbi:hypothetical protein PPL_08884 [Heterostelium album PN500]|uniref:Uncharacterized protein n=1 Tax=Heterostelium pallidum (strain ATCC 26659 / Pp 5 / PN500) TaxID=670386 RepID=D3BK03_HETP5|nr:hypothetical protein PPL_08884 [Heterostelium album PN500]EFA78233.1 hypothetical protein PPL_08884 [Heterostelium album PN500]|eukprot:XP_020430358.1 hypothetical protein PPL_08884 [Heterostelium album PN500]